MMNVSLSDAAYAQDTPAPSDPVTTPRSLEACLLSGVDPAELAADSTLPDELRSALLRRVRDKHRALAYKARYSASASASASCAHTEPSPPHNPRRVKTVRTREAAERQVQELLRHGVKVRDWAATQETRMRRSSDSRTQGLLARQQQHQTRTRAREERAAQARRALSAEGTRRAGAMREQLAARCQRMLDNLATTKGESVATQKKARAAADTRAADSQNRRLRVEEAFQERTERVSATLLLREDRAVEQRRAVLAAAQARTHKMGERRALAAELQQRRAVSERYAEVGTRQLLCERADSADAADQARDHAARQAERVRVTDLRQRQEACSRIQALKAALTKGADPRKLARAQGISLEAAEQPPPKAKKRNKTPKKTAAEAPAPADQQEGFSNLFPDTPSPAHTARYFSKWIYD